jgi:hypothetical protein
MFGGCGTCTDSSWAWSGSNWAQPAVSDATGDLVPLGRSSFGMTYDAHRGRLVVFGGDGPSSVLGDTWELYSAQSTPSGVFVAALNSSGIPAGAQFTALTVRATAGATAQDATGQPKSGVQLAPFFTGAWRSPSEAHSNAAGAATPAPVSWTTTDSAQLGVLLQRRTELDVGLLPLGTNGTGNATLTATDVEVEVGYRLP